MNKKTVFILILISALSLFINLYKKDGSPPCFNTDESAFGYNAYSLLKTGKDEYGTSLPLRLKSFGDYKLPLYSYLSIPFIALGGLNEISAKALNTVIAILFPWIIYLLVQHLFGKKTVGYLSALLFSLSPGIQVIGRQAHEAYLTTFLIILSLWLLIKMIDIKSSKIFKFLFFVSLFPLSFGYQFSRLWLGIFLIIFCYLTLKKRVSLKLLILYIIFFGFLVIPDFLVNPTRVKNLLFFNNIGLGLQTTELRSEGGSRLIYNKATVGLKNFIYEHLKYYSPEFLVIEGDKNIKFNYQGISPITIVEYLFVFIGLYYLFKKKGENNFIIYICLLFTPLTASLSWATASITRSLPLIIFMNIVAAYGFVMLLTSLSNKSMQKIIILISSCLYLIFCFYSWDFYYNHYSKRAIVIRSWQCGNREMANFIKENYQKFDQFFITKKNGQPYIFLLFYLNYPPEKYQKQANLSTPDDFGFGQINKFDKFNFDLQYNPSLRKTAFIGYPEDFNNIPLDQTRLTKITVANEEVFWIYSNE